MNFREIKLSIGLVVLPIVGCTHLPISTDFQYGLLQTAQDTLFKKEEPLNLEDFPYTKDKQTQSYVESVGGKLITVASASRYTSFHVLGTPFVQGLSNGIDQELFITEGMLRSMHNEAELASLLGHEIGHMELRHMETRFKDKGQLLDLIADEAESKAKTQVGISRHRYEIASSNYGKDQEEKADEYGAELAAKAGYYPFALCDLFDRLSQNVKDGILVKIGNLKGSHKSLKNRSEHLRKHLVAKGYVDIKLGLFAHRFSNKLASLNSKKQQKLTNEERQILVEVAGFQKEVDNALRAKRPLPARRFIQIMDRVSELAKKYELPKDTLLLGEKPYSENAFMQEHLVQTAILWALFKPHLTTDLSHLLASLGRIGIGFIPTVGSSVDLYELLSGKEFVTGEKLTNLQRGLTATGLILGQGKILRGAGEGILKTARELGTHVPTSGPKTAVHEIEEALIHTKKVFDSAGKIERFGPTNAGPLHSLTLKGGGTVADTFRSSSYIEVTLKEPTKLYRVYGGGAGKLAPYWSRVKPTGPLQATLDSALDPSWGNHANKWVEIVVPASTKIYEGFVSEVALHASKSKMKIGQLLGGGSQVYINERIPGSWISLEGVF